jgi:hypothetical protein
MLQYYFRRSACAEHFPVQLEIDEAGWQDNLLLDAI